MRYRAVLVVLAMLLTSAGCGGGGTDTSSTTSGTADGTSPSGTSAGGFFVRDLIGTWENTTYVLTVTDDTKYSVAASAAPDVALMDGFVAGMGGSVSFATNTTGECPAQTGTYDAAIEGDTLTLTATHDPCEARAAGFAEPFTHAG